MEIKHWLVLPQWFHLLRSGITGTAVFSLLVLQANCAPATPKGNNPPAHLTVQDTPINRDLRAPISFAPVAKKVGPSVVNIYTKTTVRERSPMNPFFNDPLFRRFFGDQFGSDGRPRERTAQSLGSGVIVSPEGYILTASHVVEGADEVKVSLSTGDKEYSAKVIGADPPSDIAVLKIEAQNLQTLVLGNSDKLEVGDMVLAVGNPFGVGQTITLGLISALQRGGFGISGYENFIQTDAAINPGNSGGALVDVEGRLVGINTAIISRTGGSQGVGFAVPVNMARYVMERLIKEGKVTRGYLGINIQPLTPELAKALDLPDESSGVVVGGVSPRSPAEKAGLRDGDVIVQLNDKKVTDPRSLQLQISQNAPGTKVNLRVLRSERGGRPSQRNVTVTLGELPQEGVPGAEQARPGKSEGSNMDSLDGVEVTDLDNRTRRELGVPQNVRGALVTSVDPGSNAAQAGLQTGDVILEINRQPVTNADDAVNLSNKATGDRILLRVWSGGQGRPGGTRYIVVDNKK